MKEKEFKEWLINERHQAESAAQSRLNNCRRLDAVYDLDKQYESDHCKTLLDILIYSRAKERASAPARHAIPIDGSIYGGTASLRAALKRYVEFRDAEL